LNNPSVRNLHREAWPAATPEQRDTALKRRFEDGLISTEMIQFLRLHARDLDFHATVIKARQFADATGQSKPKIRVNFVDTRPKSLTQPQWEPLLQGFKEIMAEALQPLHWLFVHRHRVTPLVQPRLPHTSRALPRHSSIRRRKGHGRTSSRVTVRVSGEEMPTSPVERVVDCFSRRVEIMAKTDHRHHRTHSGTNGSFSNVLPPRLHLIVHVAVQDVMCAVTDVVIRRFIDAMVLYRLITVVHRLLETTSVTVEPPLA